MGADLLVAEGIVKRYGNATVLHGVTVTFRAGEVHGLIGHNGAGKSTLLKIIAGAVVPDGGTVRLEGQPVSFSSPSAAASAGVASVFQELSLLENLTVTQNLFLARELGTAGVLDKKAMQAQASDLLRTYGLPLTGQEKVASLPVAQRQMIEIISALARNARVILLDEPTTALERRQIDQLVHTLRRIARERQVAIVIVDHKLDEIFAVCDHVTALTDGRVVLNGPIASLTHADVVESIVGKDEAAASHGNRPSSPRLAADVKALPALTVEGIGAPRGLKSVSFDLAPGEILGLYGLAGSGRSRLLRTLYGLEPFEWGRMTLRGQVYHPASPRNAMKSGLTYLSEERKANGFIPEFDAVRNCMLPVLGRHAWLGMIRKHEAEQEALVVLRSLRIRGNIRAPLGRLSGGNQQKALLAKAVLQKPSILLLDEPTKGIDVGTKSEIHAFIRRMAKESGVAVLVVSTEEEELLTVCDDIIIMNGGHCSGERHEVVALDSGTLRRLALAPPRPDTRFGNAMETVK
ncbi:sugar ABC transporter ATP-binding protein [Acidisoma silvae]|uniref:Sugar ABC transporter ATP-binding protein n=1 Tax=Acidisoma silvae TaxID=2802396 RepID=A0A963YXM9_9PROT|nr:sugar ABC transporter ATP-binding protein [Acidisoma silvae]MCB8878180.1 sugar ABC transporter ATP-binding protein [Acidisoma silvae]